MSSTTISRRIFGCLLLALLSQYAEARKPHYLESILEALYRLENMLESIQQVEQNTLNCLVPAEKLFSLFSELQISSIESNEIKSNGENSAFRRALDNDVQQLSKPKRQKRRKKNKNRNENVNVNINENENSNTNRQYRRSLNDVNPRLSTMHNKNSNYNSNYNLNKNRGDMFADFSNEDEI